MCSLSFLLSGWTSGCCGGSVHSMVVQVGSTVWLSLPLSPVSTAGSCSHTQRSMVHKQGNISSSNSSSDSHRGPNVKRLRILMICLRSGSFGLSAYSGCHLCGTISNSANAWLTFERDAVPMLLLLLLRTDKESKRTRASRLAIQSSQFSQSIQKFRKTFLA